MLLAILVFVIFASGTAVLAKQAGGFGRSSRGRLGGSSKSRGFGRSGKGRSGSSSRSKTGGRSARSTGGGSRAGRTSGGGRGSWFFKAWNASGAPKTSETSFRGASAVLTGKAAGSAARGGWWVSKRTGKAGSWFAGRALTPFDRWLERKRAGLETAAGLPEPTGSATPDGKPEPVRTPPPVFVHRNSSKGETPVGSFNTTKSAGNTDAPATLAPHINHVAEFEPENDAELLEFMKAEVAGQLAIAEAVEQMFENCVTGKGLDPAAMQGISDYAQAFAENAERAKQAHQQFLAVYEAIIEAANNGTQMPYDGRFFSGEAAA